MDGSALIRNVGGSRLHSEDDLDDTNLTNQIFPNIIKNIPLESPRSSLTKASRLSATDLGCIRTTESWPKAARKVKDNGLIRNMGGEDDLKDIDTVHEIFLILSEKFLWSHPGHHWPHLQDYRIQNWDIFQLLIPDLLFAWMRTRMMKDMIATGI